MKQPLETSFKHHFLIAMPGLADPNFAYSLTYLCEHTKEGAMGLIINRPLEVTIGEILAQLNISHYAEQFNDLPALGGGPVQPERGFILHRNASLRAYSAAIDQDLYLCTSRDGLETLAQQETPGALLIALGYAGWGAGQLEEEMSRNAWLSVPADSDIIFNTPFEQRWQAAASLLGVDLRLLSMDAGHA